MLSYVYDLADFNTQQRFSELYLQYQTISGSDETLRIPAEHTISHVKLIRLKDYDYHMAGSMMPLALRITSHLSAVGLGSHHRMIPLVLDNGVLSRDISSSKGRTDDETTDYIIGSDELQQMVKCGAYDDTKDFILVLNKHLHSVSYVRPTVVDVQQLHAKFTSGNPEYIATQPKLRDFKRVGAKSQEGVPRFSSSSVKNSFHRAFLSILTSLSHSYQSEKSPVKVIDYMVRHLDPNAVTPERIALINNVSTAIDDDGAYHWDPKDKAIQDSTQILHTDNEGEPHHGAQYVTNEHSHRTYGMKPYKGNTKGANANAHVSSKSTTVRNEINIKKEQQKFNAENAKSESASNSAISSHRSAVRNEIDYRDPNHTNQLIKNGEPLSGNNSLTSSEAASEKESITKEKASEASVKSSNRASAPDESTSSSSTNSKLQWNTPGDSGLDA